MAALRAFWEQHGEGILRTWNHLWDAVTTYFRMVWENIKGIFRVFSAAFRGDWEEVGRQLRQIWERTWDAFGEILAHLWEAIKPALTGVASKIVTW